MNRPATRNDILAKKINASKVIDDYADFVNISPEQIVPTREIERKQNEQEELQKQQQTIEQAKQGVEIIQNIAGTDVTGGDLMERLGIL